MGTIAPKTGPKMLSEFRYRNAYSKSFVFSRISPVAVSDCDTCTNTRETCELTEAILAPLRAWNDSCLREKRDTPALKDGERRTMQGCHLLRVSTLDLSLQSLDSRPEYSLSTQRNVCYGDCPILQFYVCRRSTGVLWVGWNLEIREGFWRGPGGDRYQNLLSDDLGDAWYRCGGRAPKCCKRGNDDHLFHCAAITFKEDS